MPSHPLLTWGPLNIAHRGGARERPEHTLLAYDHALSVGADVLELDLHRSADGAVVVMHDDTVDRTTDGTGPIAEMTLEAIRALDAGYSFGAGEGYPYRGMGLSVPTLAEVFDAHPEALFLIEIKADNEELERAVVEEIRARGLLPQVAVSAFADSVIRRVRALAPDLVTGMSLSEQVALAALRPCQGGRYVPPAPLLNSPANIVDEALVSRLMRFGLYLHSWTVNEEAEMERLLDLGAPGIITDRPSALEEVYRRRGLRP